jgi:hypothetical protein
MKARIIGTIFVLVILGALYVVTNDDGQPHPTSNTQQVDPNAGALQGLKIN